MPKGSHLTTEHQRDAAQQPRPPRVPRELRGLTAPSNETMNAALLRYQQAKADTESLDAEKRALDVAKARRELIPADEARDALEAVHLRWVAELDQLPHMVATSLPPETPSSLREQVRFAVEAACLAARKRIGTP